MESSEGSSLLNSSHTGANERVFHDEFSSNSEHTVELQLEDDEGLDRNNGIHQNGNLLGPMTLKEKTERLHWDSNKHVVRGIGSADMNSQLVRELNRLSLEDMKYLLKTNAEEHLFLPIKEFVLLSNDQSTLEPLHVDPKQLLCAVNDDLQKWVTGLMTDKELDEVYGIAHTTKKKRWSWKRILFTLILAFLLLFGISSAVFFYVFRKGRTNSLKALKSEFVFRNVSYDETIQLFASDDERESDLFTVTVQHPENGITFHYLNTSSGISVFSGALPLRTSEKCRKVWENFSCCETFCTAWKGLKHSGTVVPSIKKELKITNELHEGYITDFLKSEKYRSVLLKYRSGGYAIFDLSRGKMIGTIDAKHFYSYLTIANPSKLQGDATLRLFLVKDRRNCCYKYCEANIAYAPQFDADFFAISYQSLRNCAQVDLPDEVRLNEEKVKFDIIPRTIKNFIIATSWAERHHIFWNLRAFQLDERNQAKIYGDSGVFATYASHNALEVVFRYVEEESAVEVFHFKKEIRSPGRLFLIRHKVYFPSVKTTPQKQSS